MMLCCSNLCLNHMKMYWQSPSCGISVTYNVQGWGPRCSQPRARGVRAQRGGRGAAEGSPLILEPTGAREGSWVWKGCLKAMSVCSALELLQAALGGRRYLLSLFLGWSIPAPDGFFAFLIHQNQSNKPGGWAGLISGASLITISPSPSVSPSVPAWVCSAPQAAHPWLSQARLTFLCIHSPARISPSNWNLSPSKWQLPF